MKDKKDSIIIHISNRETKEALHNHNKFYQFMQQMERMLDENDKQIKERNERR